MQWSARWSQDTPPDMDDVAEFTDSELFAKLNSFLQESYHAQPKLSYSKCSLQKGWNVKYQKGGKSLCTLYPMMGYFIALVVIGQKEEAEASLLMPQCSSYTKRLFDTTPFSAGGKWLMINVTEPEILEDVKNLIKIRVSPKQV